MNRKKQIGHCRMYLHEQFKSICYQYTKIPFSRQMQICNTIMHEHKNLLDPTIVGHMYELVEEYYAEKIPAKAPVREVDFFA